MTRMYVWLVSCPTCKEAIRLETMTEAKQAFSKHMKKCTDVEKPRLVEAVYIGT